MNTGIFRLAIDGNLKNFGFGSVVVVIIIILFYMITITSSTEK